MEHSNKAQITSQIPASCPQKSGFALLALLALAFVVVVLSSCLRELSQDDACGPQGDIPVWIVVDWADADPASLPEYMRYSWYPDGGGVWQSQLERTGGLELLSEGSYSVVCYDYYGNQGLEFRNQDTPGSFEVRNRQASGPYNQYAYPVPGEQTVSEAIPPVFYIDQRLQTVDLSRVPKGDTLKLYFYPKNVLQEFTFMVYGIREGRRMVRNSGAISGMSASYFPEGERMAERPSTILFDRVNVLIEGQKQGWSNEEMAAFATKNPNWASADSLVGWTGDWITGAFSTFGPVNANASTFRLTVEAFTAANFYYYGYWEQSVGQQIRGAMQGDVNDHNATWEERRAWWRARNGGFDIVLHNNKRLAVTESGGEPRPGEEGFDVDTNPWIKVPVEIGGE